MSPHVPLEPLHHLTYDTVSDKTDDVHETPHREGQACTPLQFGTRSVQLKLLRLRSDTLDGLFSLFRLIFG